MSESEKYCQCEFRRGNTITVGYIPSWAACAGNEVELPEVGEGWWLITKVASMLVDKEFVRGAERAHKGFQGSLAGGGIDE